MSDERITYYAVAFDGREWVELLITREHGRQVSSVPTGATFRTAKAAHAAMQGRNR